MLRWILGPLFCLGLLSGLFLVFSEDSPLRGIYLNNAGNEYLQQALVGKAQRNYLMALKKNPRDFLARINLGMTFVAGEEFDKAAVEFGEPIRQFSDNAEVNFISEYNQGRAFQELKQVDRALEHYQNALAYKSDSIEVKANIELMTQNQQGQGGSGAQDNQNDQKDNKDKNEGEGEKDPQDPKKDSSQPPKPPQEPKGPQELSKKDIEKIMEELKNQEQKIRATEYGKEGSEVVDDATTKTW